MLLYYERSLCSGFDSLVVFLCCGAGSGCELLSTDRWLQYWVFDRLGSLVSDRKRPRRRV